MHLGNLFLTLKLKRKEISLVTAGGYLVLEIQQKHMPEMAAVSQPSQIFEIGENGIKVKSHPLYLSLHSDLYVFSELSSASEFEACLGL